MKILGGLIALFAICVILCCGVGAYLAPSKPAKSPTTVASYNKSNTSANVNHSAIAASPESPDELTTGDASPQPKSASKVDLILADRTLAYEHARDQWQAAHDARAEAESELRKITAQQAEVDVNKPTPPVFEPREWITVDNKYKTIATLLTTDNLTAILTKSDGTTITVPKVGLIAASRIYIEDAFAKFTEYREALEAWGQSKRELDGLASALKERIAAADRPEPEAPRREDIVAEVKAEEAKEQERERIAQKERDRLAAEAARYKMGTTVSVGYTSYVIWSAKWVNKISDNTYLNEKPNANFLLVNITVRNNDKKARQIPPFKLVDEYGAEYQTSSKLGLDNAIGILDSLNPDVSKRGNILFDVPKYRKYKLQLDGGFWSAEKKTVELTIN